MSFFSDSVLLFFHVLPIFTEHSYERRWPLVNAYVLLCLCLWCLYSVYTSSRGTVTRRKRQRIPGDFCEEDTHVSRARTGWKGILASLTRRDVNAPVHACLLTGTTLTFEHKTCFSLVDFSLHTILLFRNMSSCIDTGFRNCHSSSIFIDFLLNYRCVAGSPLVAVFLTSNWEITRSRNT